LTMADIVAATRSRGKLPATCAASRIDNC
jgi:hypothetical protein